MQNLGLLAAAAAIILFGWFLMKGLDCTLANDEKVQVTQVLSSSKVLRIGFFNPLLADSMADILEEYSKIYPDVSVRFYCDSGKELIKKLSEQKLDVIFLPETVEIPDNTYYKIRRVLLSYGAVTGRYSGLPVEPVAGGHAVQKALWLRETKTAFVRDFMEYLHERTKGE